MPAATVLAYITRSYILPAGALAPIVLLVLARGSVFKIEQNRMTICERVPIAAFGWGKDALKRSEKLSQGPFSKKSLQTRCEKVLQEQRETEGVPDFAELLSVKGGKKMLLDRLRARRQELRKASQVYFGRPALHPLMAKAPFYHFMVTDKLLDSVLQIIFECRHRGDQRSILAISHFIMNMLQAEESGLVPSGTRKSRRSTIKMADHILKVSRRWW